MVEAAILTCRWAGLRPTHPSQRYWLCLRCIFIVNLQRGQKIQGRKYRVCTGFEACSRGDTSAQAVEWPIHNATVFREFLKRLITGMTRKIFLIVDGHPMHKAKLVKRFVEENSASIELFFLPPLRARVEPR